MVNEGIQAFGSGHILNFQDEDGQLLGLTYHESIGEMLPVEIKDIPAAAAIVGIAGIQMRVRKEKALIELLVDCFGFVEENRFEYQGQEVISLVFDNEFQHRVQVMVDKESKISVIGVGGIHHVAFGVLDESDLEEMVDHLNLHNRPHSGIINRDFMHSLYFRAPNYLMFEVATMNGDKEAPMPNQSFKLDEVELFLPSFLEQERLEIEKILDQRY